VIRHNGWNEASPSIILPSGNGTSAKIKRFRGTARGVDHDIYILFAATS
jgi:hypothetical protein